VRVGRISDENGEGKKADFQFEIKDTGGGVAPDELEGIFEAFVQSESGRESREGTGLGLTISRKFVRMMGGEIIVESEVGGGTVFKFWIQAGVVDGAGIRTPLPTRHVIALAPGQPEYRVLIVDDKESNRLLLFRLLSLPGFELREAENGGEAVKIWEKWEPHLIFMDMRMPVMDGYEAVGRIKSAAKGQAAAVIAVTAGVFEEERSAVLAAGCDDFVRKPFDDAEIFEVIHRHLGVEYVYCDDADPSARKIPVKDKLKTFTPEALGALPVELIRNLKDAVLLGYFDRIERLTEDIRLHDAALAGALAMLAADFEYGRIQDVIEAVRDTEEKGDP